MDRKICKRCQIEIHQEKTEFNGEEKLSWRNPDGSPHYWPEVVNGETVFRHCAVVDVPLAVKLARIQESLDEILERVK